jgi:hypothetical protein
LRAAVEVVEGVFVEEGLGVVLELFLCDFGVFPQQVYLALQVFVGHFERLEFEGEFVDLSLFLCEGLVEFVEFRVGVVAAESGLFQVRLFLFLKFGEGELDVLVLFVELLFIFGLFIKLKLKVLDLFFSF